MLADAGYGINTALARTALTRMGLTLCRRHSVVGAALDAGIRSAPAQAMERGRVGRRRCDAARRAEQASIGREPTRQVAIGRRLA